MPLINGRPITVLDDVRVFWPTVRRELGYVSDRAVADRPRLTREAILKKLTTNERWLQWFTFDAPYAEGFDFLGQPEKRQLVAAVELVRGVAKEIPEDGRPTAEQLDRARPPFADVVELMGFDRYDEADDFYFGKQIERRLKPWPPQLDHLRFENGSDHAGYPALWVWAYLTAAASDSDEQVKRSAGLLRPILREAAREVAPDRFPYVSFRSVSDPVVEGATR
jgi:hypothetical protein